MTTDRKGQEMNHAVEIAAERFWKKIHDEGLCPRDPYPWQECALLRDTLDDGERR